MNPTAALYHLALRDEWAAAVAEQRSYDRSTIGRSLDQEGFIHASFASQVRDTARAFYRGSDVVLLTIDQRALDAEVRIEEVADGRSFPHVYGPIPLAAVRSADEVPVLSDGTHDFSGLLPE